MEKFVFKEFACHGFHHVKNDNFPIRVGKAEMGKMQILSQACLNLLILLKKLTFEDEFMMKGKRLFSGRYIIRIELKQ